MYGQLVSNPPTSDPHQVWVDEFGKLGQPPVSSRRFKQDIRDLGDDSRAILDLRPVAFRYKRTDGAAPEKAREPGPLQNGLFAEEVAEVLPSFVRWDAEGLPLAVDYHELIPLLLNELQRQERELAALREEVERLDRGRQPADRARRSSEDPPKRRDRDPARR